MSASNFTDMFGGAIDWLLAPISGSPDHTINSYISWHGRLMTITWLVLVPLSILIARFYKITPRQDWPRILDNPFWFIWHRRIGYLSLTFMLAALAAVICFNGGRFNWLSAHAIGGWCLLALGAVQIINALLRGTHGGPVNPLTRKTVPPEKWHGDHFSMTPRRVVFEYVHKILGYAAVALIPLALFSGLALADAPHWMWIGAGLLMLSFVAVFAVLQRQGRCVDTYQAIWGLSGDLPGNRRKRSIGWGIRRITTAKPNDGSAPKFP